MKRCVVLVAFLVLGCQPSAGTEDMSTKMPDQGGDVTSDMADMSEDQSQMVPESVKFATFNASMYRNAAGALVTELGDPSSSQPRGVAEILQRVRPDVVLLNEFDHDAAGEAVKLFQENFLGVAQQGAEPIVYEHVYVATSNTGQPSGVDLDNSGSAVTEPGSPAYGNDSFGFGRYPGQYAFVVLSKYPLGTTRTFQKLLWSALPNNLMPTGFYSQEAQDVFRLSSKNHVDVPVSVGGTEIHFLVSHPTPPAFDGAEERNKRRNNDEVRLWIDYLSDDASHLVDDAGVAGGLGEGEFVIAGDLNVDPVDGLEAYPAIRDLVGHPRVQDTSPRSEGAPEASTRDGGANQSHKGDAALDTADFSDGSVGNRRVDYVLPSKGLNVQDSGVYWLPKSDPLSRLMEVSDHRLVWVELKLK